MIQKTPSIAAPFRRQLFEPYDQIIYNPIGHITLHPHKKTNTNKEPAPIIDEQGNKFYRLSDIKKKIREEIEKREEEIRQRFVKDYKDELAINIQRRDQAPPHKDTDSHKEDDSAKDSDSPKGDESKDDQSPEDDDAMHLYL